MVITSEGHDQPHNWLRLNPVAVLTVAEARARWWITDAGREWLVDAVATAVQINTDCFACPTCHGPLED